MCCCEHYGTTTPERAATSLCYSERWGRKTACIRTTGTIVVCLRRQRLLTVCCRHMPKQYFLSTLLLVELDAFSRRILLHMMHMGSTRTPVSVLCESISSLLSTTNFVYANVYPRINNTKSSRESDLFSKGTKQGEIILIFCVRSNPFFFHPYFCLLENLRSPMRVSRR